MTRRRVFVRSIGTALAAALLALGVHPPAPATAAGSDVTVGVIYSKTGLLGSYGQQYMDGFQAGLDYATHGTGMAGGHKLVIAERDDAGDPAKAVAAGKDLIGQGVHILAGSTASGVALQMAALANENKVLFISGPAAADAVTGNNRYTFRSGRQSMQDVETAGTIVGSNLRGKHVLVFAQDTAFGQANVAAVRIVLGAEGASVDSVLAPLTVNDFSPFAQKVKDAHPDLLFIAWAGTTAGAMWKSLDDQHVFDTTKVVTGLDMRASYPVFGPVAAKITFLSHYFSTAPHNAVNDAMIARLKKAGKVADLFSPDGFVAAQMIVHAVEKAGGDDPAKTVPALEGWQFAAPKGVQVIRAADHAMLQPMFVAKLEPSATGFEPKLLRTIPREAVAPPVRPFK